MRGNLHPLKDVPRSDSGHKFIQGPPEGSGAAPLPVRNPERAAPKEKEEETYRHEAENIPGPWTQEIHEGASFRFAEQIEEMGAEHPIYWGHQDC
jgi:hypothetical protein